jgi:hypothetical protein
MLAVDPGGTTGWAVFDLMFYGKEPLWLPEFSSHFTRSGQLGPDDHHNALDTILEEEMPDLVVCERFEHRNNEFSELTSVEYIGVVKQWCQQHKRKLVLQGASQALPWADNKKMRCLGVLVTPVQAHRHDNDARRHIVYMLANRPKDRRISDHVLQLMRYL